MCVIISFYVVMDFVGLSFVLEGFYVGFLFFFFSSRRRHTRLTCDWSSDVCSSDLGSRRREPGLEPAACPVRHAADQPSARLQCRRRLHQWRRILLLPPAPGRTRASPPHRWAVSPPLCPGGSLARGPPPRQQRRADARRRPPGDAMQAIGRFLRLLAACTRRLAQSPSHHTRRLGALDRLFRPLERTENGLLDQR